MQGFEIVLLTIGVVFAVALIVLIVKAVLWTGRDARQRGFRPVWLLQLLVVLDFPWPFLIYYLVSRNLDRSAEPV
jgi:hypothetical protein